MRLAAILALIATALGGCAPGQSLGARYVVRSAASVASPNEAFGAQVRVIDASNMRYHGEAIACDERRVYVRLNVTDSDRDPYVAVDWDEVATVDVALPGMGWAYGLWTALGTLSTISHGWFAAATHAAWLGVGIPSSVAGSNPHISAADCRALQAYLRFPQGMPDGFRASHFAGTGAVLSTEPAVPPSAQPPSQPPSNAPWAVAPEPTPAPDAPSPDAGAASPP